MNTCAAQRNLFTGITKGGRELPRRRILITGGAGFIGSHIVDRFLAAGWAVRVLDSLEPQVHGRSGLRPAYLDQRAELVIGDITNRDLVEQVIQDVDVLSHHAAAVGVGQSMYEIERYARTNALGAAVVLDRIANAKHRVRKLIVASSMSVYGEGSYRCATHGEIEVAGRSREQLRDHLWDPACSVCAAPLKPTPTTEHKRLAPASVYAIHKRDHEELFRVVGRAYGIPTIAFRYFNAYGPRQALSNPYTGVVAIFASRIRSGKPPVVFEDGNQMRDFVSVHDIADLNLMAAESDRECEGVFNVGSGKPRSVREIAEIVANALGSEIVPEVTGRFREGDIRHCFGDIAHAKDVFGWEPTRSLEREIGPLVVWAATQEAGDGGDSANETLVRRGLAR